MPYSNIDEVPKHTTAIVFLLGFFGAMINYNRRKNKTTFQKILLFISDMISSVMLSITTFASVVGFGGNEILAVGLAGFVAHQGTRAVYIIEIIIAKKIGVDLDVKDEVKK